MQTSFIQHLFGVLNKRNETSFSETEDINITVTRYKHMLITLHPAHCSGSLNQILLPYRITESGNFTNEVAVT